ncbi:hypothetical protein [Methylobacterium sp. SD21]|uniref:hypothetical protein n=1 Tax=Methylobacterium litchii TaxID=3138810 RepID=UPI00313BE6FF
MMDHEDTPLRRAVVTAWALYQGYTVRATTWYPECEGIEAWAWDDPTGTEVGENTGDHTFLPEMPDALFEKLNRECRWQGVS